MTDRYYILVGDKTTANGTVISGHSMMQVEGREMAYEDDKVDCPACKSIGIIQIAGSRIANKGPHGKEAALEGDLCICKCSPFPVLVASQHTMKVSV